MIKQIIQANNEHINDCVLALQKSELGKVYFSEQDKAIKAITKGISKEEIFVAIDKEDNCLGFMWHIRNGAFLSFSYLHIIAIKEDYRNNGIGNEMLNYYENELAQSSKSFLIVADFNPRAKQLYEKRGYKEVGVIPNLYKSGVTEFLMMKELL